MSVLPISRDEAAFDVAEALHRTQRSLKYVSAIKSLGLWVAATVVYLLAFVVVDHARDGGVPRLLQLALAGGYGLATIGWLIWGVIRPLARRINELYAARLVERTHPEIRNSLVSALQLNAQNDLPGSVRTAVVARAAEDVAHVDPRRSVRKGVAWVVAAANLSLIVGFAIFSVITPKATWPSVLRALGFALPAPTRVNLLDVLPEDGLIVERNKPVAFSAKTLGVTPETAYAQFRFDDGMGSKDDADNHEHGGGWVSAHRLPLRPLRGRELGCDWQATKQGRDVQQPMCWRIVAGDAISEIRYLDVRPEIQLTIEYVELQYPKYTKQPPRKQDVADIDAIVGTEARIHAKANVEIRDAVLVIVTGNDERRRLITASAAQPQAVVADLIVRESGHYHLEFRDELGRVNSNPIQHSIRARHDAVPRLSLLAARNELSWTMADSLPIRGQVDDDFGVTRVVLGIRDAGKSQVRELPLADDPDGVVSCPLDRAVSMPDLGLKQGNAIEWRVTAWDNRHNAAGQLASQRVDGRWHRLAIPDSPMPPEPPLDEPEPIEAANGGQPPTVVESTGKPGDSDGQDAGKVDDDGSGGQDGTQTGKGDGVGGDEDGQDEQAIEDFVRDHAKQLEALARHFDAQQQATGAGREGPAQASPDFDTAEGHRDEDGASAGDESVAGKSAGDESKDGGDPGNATAAGAGSDSVNKQEQGASSGNDKGEGEGQAEAEGDGKGPGAGEGEGEGEGQGEGEGEGEGQGEGAGKGKGEGQGQGESAGEGQEEGQGKGSGDTPGQGGGAPTGESSKPFNRPEQERNQNINPLPKPAHDEAPLVPKGRVAELVGALDRAIRRGELDQELLDELGWDVTRTRQFVEAYERLDPSAELQSDRTELPSAARETDRRQTQPGEIKRGVTGGNPAGKRLNAVHQRQESAKSDVMAVGKQRVPSQYRSLLEAYYQSITSRPAE